jgi:glycosyltransferase involved in cell wall biosynthesis
MISCIVTTRNEEKVIGALLESIKSQSYKDIEIVLVDNNSEDKTKKIARKFGARVFNKGPERSVQRNFGVSKASGKYLLILDADMELSPGVVKDCVKTIEKSKHKGLVIPEETVGESWIARVRRFERQMYMGDMTIEVARFYVKKAFDELGGYDIDLTGPEDYDLHKRVSEKYSIGRTKDYIFHHEEELTLGKLLKKKFYYANKGAKYAEKHPDLVVTQGTIFFRKAYLRNWKKFIKEPFLGIGFIGVRILETIWALAGYIKAVGLVKFFKTLTSM